MNTLSSRLLLLLGEFLKKFVVCLLLFFWGGGVSLCSWKGTGQQAGYTRFPLTGKAKKCWQHMVKTNLCLSSPVFFVRFFVLFVCMLYQYLNYNFVVQNMCNKYVAQIPSDF